LRWPAVMIALPVFDGHGMIGQNPPE
jgi:hypothetical protein